MVPRRDPQLTRARALALADSVPEARQALLFLAQIATFTGGARALEQLARDAAPAPLHHAPPDPEAARRAYLSGADVASPAAFYGRILASLDPPPAPQQTNIARCPRCDQPPQCAVLRQEAETSALWLVCSLCEGEWRYPRGRCAHCGERRDDRLTIYSSERAMTQVCAECGVYLHWIDAVRHPGAVPFADEAAALAVDAWCAEQGWRKLHPNLIGI